MRWFIEIILWVLLGATQLPAGTVRTLDGKTLEGEVRLEDAAVSVVPKTGPILRVPFDNLMRATWMPVSPIEMGLILADGSTLACERFISADNLTVKFVRGGREATLPIDKVSRLIFSGAGHAPAPAGATGAILANRDFFEGDFQALAGGRIRVSSVLFGLRSMALKTEVSGIVLRRANRLSADNIVRWKDGTEKATRLLSIKRTGVETDDGVLTLKDLAEIRSGAAAQPLVDLSPAEAPGVWIDSTPPGVPPVLFNRPGERSLSISVGAALTISLNESYRTLSASVGVPLGIAPALKAGLIVRGDGKELARVPLRGSIDDPAALAVNIAGVKTLVLQPFSGTTALPAFVVLVDPLLIKAR